MPVFVRVAPLREIDDIANPKGSRKSQAGRYRDQQDELMADPLVLEALNHDIWHPFRRAYAARDVDAFVALYAPDLIRAGGPTAAVYGFDRYAAETAEWFADLTARGANVAIDFRFFERIASDNLASERGCYRIDTDVRVFHGRFHTFSRKQNGVWRIAVDYDTNDGGTVDADSFAAGAGIDDTTRFP